MHSRKTQAVKKRKKTSDHATQDIISLIDGIESIVSSELPTDHSGARKYLVSVFKTLADMASYYNKILTFPSSDLTERKMEQQTIQNLVVSMREITLRALNTIDLIEGKEEE